MVLENNPRLRAEFFQDEFERFRIVGESGGVGSNLGTTFIELFFQLNCEAGLVEIEEITEQTGSPDPAKAAMPLEQTDFRPGPGGGDGSGHTCGLPRTRSRPHPP